MDQYAKENAANRIDAYYNPTPSESALEKYVEAFERAKAETVKNLRVALEQTETLSVEDFFNITNRGLLLQYVRGELKGSVGRHDWAVGQKREDGFPTFVDDRQLSYRKTPLAAKEYALEIIARLQADGDYRLNDKPAGFLPPVLPSTRPAGKAA